MEIEAKWRVQSGNEKFGPESYREIGFKSVKVNVWVYGNMYY